MKAQVESGGIIIRSQEKLTKTITNIKQAGLENFYVVTDFDNTLTQAFIDGKKTRAVIAQIRNGKYLSPDYADKANALFDKYHPIEINANISEKEKFIEMEKWWIEHFNLLIKSGLTKQVLIDVVKQKGIIFRPGALDFIDTLKKHDIPLVIFSAGLGDMIALYLEQEGRAYDNVHIVGNLFEFDSAGKVIEIRQPIIHSLNKNKVNLKQSSIANIVQERQNILLLGDQVSDLGMAKTSGYENLISIGFLNENVEENLPYFKRGFNATLLDDQDMSFANSILKKILN